MYETISSIIQNQFCTTHNTNNAKPSSQAVAVWRAVHQLLESPSIFNDPIALRILGDAKTDVMNKLRILADKEDRSVSYVARRILKEYTENNE